MEAAKEGDLTALLLDMCELALCQLNSPASEDGSLTEQALGLQQLQAALAALQAVLTLQLPSSHLTLDMGCDVMLLLIDVAQVGNSIPADTSSDGLQHDRWYVLPIPVTLESALSSISECIVTTTTPMQHCEKIIAVALAALMAVE